jgi:hypothetical protein
VFRSHLILKNLALREGRPTGVVCGSNGCRVKIASSIVRTGCWTKLPAVASKGGAPCGGMLSLRFQLSATCPMRTHVGEAPWNLRGPRRRPALQSAQLWVTCYSTSRYRGHRASDTLRQPTATGGECHTKTIGLFSFFAARMSSSKEAMKRRNSGDCWPTLLIELSSADSAGMQSSGMTSPLWVPKYSIFWSRALSGLINRITSSRRPLISAILPSRCSAACRWRRYFLESSSFSKQTSPVSGISQAAFSSGPNSRCFFFLYTTESRPTIPPHIRLELNDSIFRQNSCPTR